MLSRLSYFQSRMCTFLMSPNFQSSTFEQFRCKFLSSHTHMIPQNHLSTPSHQPHHKPQTDLSQNPNLHRRRPHRLPNRRRPRRPHLHVDHLRPPRHHLGTRRSRRPPAHRSSLRASRPVPRHERVQRGLHHLDPRRGVVFIFQDIHRGPHVNGLVCRC